MDLTLIYTIVGFGLAGWSVIGNDSIQTLGTFIASKQKWFKWYTLASAASCVIYPQSHDLPSAMVASLNMLRLILSRFQTGIDLFV